MTGGSLRAADDARPSLPNVVVILADDLGYGDAQCNNLERGKIATTNIDRLAAQGMRFTDAHSSSGVCSPSRYTLLTGRYHWRTRLQSGIVGVWGKPLIAPERLTIGGLAKQHGYTTACIGKWHLGWDWPIPDDRAAIFKAKPDADSKATAEQQAVWREVFSQPIPGGPVARGFDQYFGTDVPNWPPYCFIENDKTLGLPSEFLPQRLLKDNQASLPGPALDGWQLEPILPTLASRASEFVKAQARAKKPFLLYMPLTAPHTPLAVNPAFRGRSGLNEYADFVLETDEAVGRVLSAIEEAGVANDTLVIFTSDNGCAPYIGAAQLEKKGHFPSGPLRGYKSDAFEGGHRVPFIVRWPRRVAAGSVCSQLVHHADVIATLAELLDTKLPPDAGEDSFSFVSLLKGGTQPVRNESVSCASGGLPSLRDGAWKLIFGPGSGGWTKGESDQPFQLFNLADDLGETKNLAAIESERVARMRQRMEQIIRAGRSTPGPAQKNDLRVRRYPPEPQAKSEAKSAENSEAKSDRKPGAQPAKKPAAKTDSPS